MGFLFEYLDGGTSARGWFEANCNGIPPNSERSPNSGSRRTTESCGAWRTSFRTQRQLSEFCQIRSARRESCLRSQAVVGCYERSAIDEPNRPEAQRRFEFDTGISNDQEYDLMKSFFRRSIVPLSVIVFAVALLSEFQSINHAAAFADDTTAATTVSSMPKELLGNWVVSYHPNKAIRQYEFHSDLNFQQALVLLLRRW